MVCRGHHGAEAEGTRRRSPRHRDGVLGGPLARERPAAAGDDEGDRPREGDDGDEGLADSAMRLHRSPEVGRAPRGGGGVRWGVRWVSVECPLGANWFCFVFRFLCFGFVFSTIPLRRKMKSVVRFRFSMFHFCVETFRQVSA